MARIAFDMDEVIVDGHPTQEAWLSQQFDGFTPTPLGKTFSQSLPKDQNDARLNKMHEGEIFGEMPPMPKAIETLRFLCSKHEVYIASAAMEFPNSCAYKYEWIQKHLPFFDPMHIVFCGDKSILNTDYLIDDNVRHFEKLSGQGILFSAKHNANTNWALKVANWQEVAEFSF